MQGQELAKSISHARLKFAIVINKGSFDHYLVPID